MFSYANKNLCISACSNSNECSERIDQRTTVGSYAQWFVLHVPQYDAASPGLPIIWMESPYWVRNITQGFPRDAVVPGVRVCRVHWDVKAGLPAQGYAAYFLRSRII